MPELFNTSLQVWNAGQGIDWNGLPVWIEMYGIKNVEQLVNDLLTIQTFVNTKED